MNDKIDNAIDSFNCGFNCSQSVFSAFSEDLGLDKKLALKIACSFGGGMCLAEVCGAVTGAFLVLGLKYGQNNDNDNASKELSKLYVKDFASRFKKLHGSIICKELLEYDLSDINQLIAARQSGVFKTQCPKYVKDAVVLLEEIMSDGRYAPQWVLVCLGIILSKIPIGRFYKYVPQR